MQGDKPQRPVEVFSATISHNGAPDQGGVSGQRSGLHRREGSRLSRSSPFELEDRLEIASYFTQVLDGVKSIEGPMGFGCMHQRATSSRRRGRPLSDARPIRSGCGSSFDSMSLSDTVIEGTERRYGDSRYIRCEHK